MTHIWRRVTFDRPPVLAPSVLALGYLLWIAVAEVVATLLEPRLGLLLYGLLLIVLLLHSARTAHRPTQNLLLALALAPLIRMLSYSLPLGSFPRVYWYFIVSLPLFAATALAVKASGLPRGAIGLRLGNLPIQLLVGLSGIAFGYVEYRILEPEPLVRNVTWPEIVLTALILLICTGFLEELVFRGFMQHSACQVLGRLGLVFVAVLFAILHIGYRSVIDVLFVLGVGFFFGWMVAWTGSILGVTLSHGITNVMLFIVMPLASISTPFAAMSGSPSANPMANPPARMSGASLHEDQGAWPLSASICIGGGAIQEEPDQSAEAAGTRPPLERKPAGRNTALLRPARRQYCLPEDFEGLCYRDEDETHEQGNDRNIQYSTEGLGSRTVSATQRFLLDQQREQNQGHAYPQRSRESNNSDR